jgi:hypothetical protein
MRYSVRAALAAAMIGALAGAFAPSPAAAQAPAFDCATVGPFNEPWPINIGLLATALREYHQCRYDADVKAVLDAARAHVAEEAPRVSKAAVVLDIDETSLSNWAQIDHNGFAYVAGGSCDLKSALACGQQDWELSAQAPAIAPTLELFNMLKGLKDKDGNPVVVFFVTGRGDNPVERAATELNLRRAGYDGWKGLLMRPDHPAGEPVSTYKSAQRRLIEESADYGYRILANIGDQMSDLEGGHAQRCFKVPNPFYYIPGEVQPHTPLDCLRP